MGASQTRLSAAVAALVIATSAFGSIAPAIAAPTTVTDEQVTEATNSPTETAVPAPSSAAPAATETSEPTAEVETSATGLPAAAAPSPAAAAPSEAASPAAAPKLQAQATAGGPGWPLYKIVYDSTIFELVTQGDGSQLPAPLSYERWRDVYGFATPTPADTNFVKYPWADTVYAVTFWPGGENYWMWTRLSFPQWQTAGYPTPRNAGWIKGSYYYKWGTSNELFVEGEDGVNHKLTGAEWASSGYRSYVDRANEGFMKPTWAPEMARMSAINTGAGRPLGYNEWRDEGFPTPQAVQRITGDKFYKDCGSNTIWYAGPAMNRPVSLQEWQGAGSPAPTVSGNCSSPAPPSQPTRPADKDCTDFRTQYEAQQWFNTYYQYYGDFALLDSDNDRIACEGLP
ncbi:excalibur calcium-binding domain-containing protein [Pseudarthrobacter sp. NPDC058329]|uniref:excalibur calcium-binding domain-containing protein n=1 Tax=Pseudarthrobacter sp. NPDC058329 TaxID=3346448 RepID=UPI0036D921F1